MWRCWFRKYAYIQQTRFIDLGHTGLRVMHEYKYILQRIFMRTVALSHGVYFEIVMLLNRNFSVKDYLNEFCLYHFRKCCVIWREISFQIYFLTVNIPSLFDYRSNKTIWYDSFAKAMFTSGDQW